MNVREKLVELQSIITCPNAICNFCEYFKNKSACEKHKKEVIADNMIANGVTVQEWIPVTDRLPENDQWAICFMKDKSFGTFRVFQWNYIDWQWNDMNEWFDEKDVTHWMPLPEPPKADEEKKKNDRKRP